MHAKNILVDTPFLYYFERICGNFWGGFSVYGAKHGIIVYKVDDFIGHIVYIRI